MPCPKTFSLSKSPKRPHTCVKRKYIRHPRGEKCPSPYNRSTTRKDECVTLEAVSHHARPKHEFFTEKSKSRHSPNLDFHRETKLKSSEIVTAPSEKFKELLRKDADKAEERLNRTEIRENPLWRRRHRSISRTPSSMPSARAVREERQIFEMVRKPKAKTPEGFIRESQIRETPKGLTMSSLETVTRPKSPPRHTPATTMLRRRYSRRLRGEEP